MDNNNEKAGCQIKGGIDGWPTQARLTCYVNRDLFPYLTDRIHVPEFDHNITRILSLSSSSPSMLEETLREWIGERASHGNKWTRYNTRVDDDLRGNWLTMIR